MNRRQRIFLFAASMSVLTPLQIIADSQQASASRTSPVAPLSPAKDKPAERKKSDAQNPSETTSATGEKPQPSTATPARTAAPSPTPTPTPTLIQRLNVRIAPGATGVIQTPGIIHYNFTGRFNRPEESAEELRAKLDLTLKAEGANSALAVEQMCDLADCYSQTSREKLAAPLIDQLTSSYSKLSTDNQHFLAQRLLSLSMHLQQNPGYGLRSQILVTTVLSALNKGHWIDPEGNLSNALLNLGNQYMGRQHLLQAEPIMKAALSLIGDKPSHRQYASMHLSMAALYERLMRYTDAEHEYRLVLAADEINRSAGFSRRSQALTQLCALYLRLDNKTKIQALIPELTRRAQESEPQEIYILDHCINQLVAQGYWAEAEQIINAELDSVTQHLDQPPRNGRALLQNSLMRWSLSFLNAGHDDAAIRLYEHWVQAMERAYGSTNLETATAFLNAAKFMIERDHIDQAQALIQKALPIGAKLHDQAFVKALADCGVALHKQRRADDAEKLLVDALEMADSDTRLSIQASLGSFYAQQGDNDKVQALSKAITSEVKERFSTSDRDIDLAITDVVQSELQHSDFADTQLFINTLNTCVRSRMLRNATDVAHIEDVQVLDAIIQTYERRQDFAAAAKVCKLEIDKYATILDARTLSSVLRRYGGLLRASGDQESALIYERRANSVTAQPDFAPDSQH